MSEIVDERVLFRPAARALRFDLILERLLLVCVFVGLWWLSSLSVPHYILPGPARVWEALKLIAGNGDLWSNLGITFWRVTVGFVFATLTGLPFGIVLGANKRAGEFFEPVLPVLNTVSSAIWAIFAIIWFGISNATTIFVVFMTAMPLIITNVWQGTRTVNADFIELAQVLRMPDWKVMTKIYLPTILPYFFSGARLAFGFGWRVSLVAETIGSSSGVGYRLRQAADLIRTDQVFAWTLTLVIMMATIEMGILKPLEKYLFPVEERCHGGMTKDAIEGVLEPWSDEITSSSLIRPAMETLGQQTRGDAGPVIRLSGISKSFGNSGAPLEVLKDVNLTVEEHAIVGLLGASGSGKSTLLNIISGILTPDSGQICICGAAGAEFNDWCAVSYMFQDDRLLPWRTALSNVEFALEAGSMPKAERERHAREALDLVDLGDFAEAFPYQLSGGMRSRVALARSLVTGPRILLMDEPFSRLDAQTRSLMHEELLRIHRPKQMTVVFVTHDVAEAVFLADQVAVMSPRPGTIREIVNIELPRPRDITRSEVAQYIQRLRALI